MNRNELFILAAKYKASQATYSRHFQEALSAGVDMSTPERMEANAPEARRAVLQSIADQEALLAAACLLPDLHMFLVDDSDYVVAETAEEAGDLWRVATQAQPGDDTLDVSPLSDDKPLTMSVDAAGEPCDTGEEGSTKVSRTAAEWAAFLGPGFAGSVNY